MIIKKCFIILLYLLYGESCMGQGVLNKFSFTPPYDSLSIKMHADKINRGASYLLLLSSSTNKEEYYLACTAWFELSENRNRTVNNVDSLLNGYSQEIISLNLIPISTQSLKYFDNKNTCDLIKMVFDENGYYIPPPYYSPSNLILASLLKKGIKIEISDYDGEPYVSPKRIDCFLK